MWPTPSAKDVRRPPWRSSSRSSAPPAADPPAPRLVIVSGPPAAGKTTLARALAHELGLTLLTKDEIKERLADADPPADRDASRALGARSYEILYRSVAALLAQGVGCVLESNFHPVASVAPLRTLAARSRATLVLCLAPAEILVERYRRRVTSRERHPAHFDELTLGLYARGEIPDHHSLEIGVPTIRVDTAAGLRPPLADIVTLVLASSGDS